VTTYIRDMIAGMKFGFICFQETILEDFSDKCLRMIDPNRMYLWDWLSVKGKSWRGGGGGGYLESSVIGLMWVLEPKESLYFSTTCGVRSWKSNGT
jgi:hypothetical protein